MKRRNNPLESASCVWGLLRFARNDDFLQDHPYQPKDSAMKKIPRIFLPVFLLLLIPATAPAADFDGSQPLICALKDNFECGPDGCERVRSEAINLPQFLRLNFKEKQITTIHEGVQGRNTRIENADTRNGKMFLRGLENDRVWSLVIAVDSGRMVLSIAGDEAGFVIFGACTTP